MAGGNTTTAAMTGNPYLIGGGMALDFLGSGLSGQPEQMESDLHLVNPAQQALYNAMTRQLLTGAGDYGGGAAYKQGKSNLLDYMANRGISSDSGVAIQGMTDLAAQSSALDQQNRNNMWLGLLGTPLQTAQTTGANYIPGSPSVGATGDVQSRSKETYRNPWAAYY